MSSSLKQTERRLPQFIHIGRSPQKQVNAKTNNAKANAAHPPPSTPPPKASLLFQTTSCTPTRKHSTTTTITTMSMTTPPTTSTASTTTSAARRRKLRGILKSPSYKFTGIRVSPKKKKQTNNTKSNSKTSGPTTPSTVASCESWDGNDSISRSSSCGSSTIGSVGTFQTTSTEGIQNAIDKIINGETTTIGNGSGRSSDNDNDTTPTKRTPFKKTHSALSSSSSSASVSSQSTSATSASTNSSTSKEELQRCARIKHIEDLKERISETKARKLVERKAYRREDKLILKLARQLKTISKKARENAVNTTILEENNQFCQECYDQCLQELQDYKASRAVATQELVREMQARLEAEREQFRRVIRVQDAELEAHKRNHQYNCQALCESVLHANNDLDRMRTLWEEHVGGTKRAKSRASLLWASILVALSIATIVVLSARTTTTTTGGSNTTTAPRYVLNGEETDGQLRTLPPLNMIRMGIIRDEDTNANAELLPSTFQSKTTTTTTTTRKSFNEETIDTTISDTASVVLAETISLDSETHAKSCKIVDGNGEKKQDGSSYHLSSSTSTSETTTTTKQQGEEGKRRRFKPKQLISNLFRR